MGTTKHTKCAQFFGFIFSIASSVTWQDTRLATVAVRSAGRLPMKEGTCAGHVSSGPICMWRQRLFAAVNLTCYSFLVHPLQMQERLRTELCAKTATSRLREEQQEPQWQTQKEYSEKILRMGHQEGPNRTKQVRPKFAQSRQELPSTKAESQVFRLQFQFPATEDGDWFQQAPTLTAKSRKERLPTQLQQEQIQLRRGHKVYQKEPVMHPRYQDLIRICLGIA